VEGGRRCTGRRGGLSYDQINHDDDDMWILLERLALARQRLACCVQSPQADLVVKEDAMLQLVRRKLGQKEFRV
jgi:hypothetical protein